MYAIVDIAGQQFKVEAGNEIFVNRLPEAKDATVEFDKVLLIDSEGQIQLGNPYVKGAVVKATVLDDEAKGVAPGMRLAHVVVLLLELPESLELVRFPDWSYLEHGSSFLAH